jgi:ABC-type microcin C transport system duplicated ATPase subunit YejF
VLAPSSEIVLEVKDLEVRVTTRSGIGRAVDGISFTLAAGETLGLVGESGSGKSLTSLAILGLQPQPAAQITNGQILFRGTDLLKKTPGELRQYRGRRIAMVLQDPMTALNPVFSVGRQLYEPLQLHRHLSGKPCVSKRLSCCACCKSPRQRAGWIAIRISSAAVCASAWLARSRSRAIRKS